MRYKIKIRWPCDCLCHHTVSSALCHLCKNTHEGWDAEGEAIIGYPYHYIENIDGGARVELDFFKEDGTPIIPKSYSESFEELT